MKPAWRRLLARSGECNKGYMTIGVDHVQITVPKKDEAAAREF